MRIIIEIKDEATRQALVAILAPAFNAESRLYASTSDYHHNARLILRQLDKALGNQETDATISCGERQ